MEFLKILKDFSKQIPQSAALLSGAPWHSLPLWHQASPCDLAGLLDLFAARARSQGAGPRASQIAGDFCSGNGERCREQIREVRALTRTLRDQR